MFLLFEGVVIRDNKMFECLTNSKFLRNLNNQKGEAFCEMGVKASKIRLKEMVCTYL